MLAVVWRLLKRGGPDGVGFSSVAIVFWLSSCFGVVLEGPMGAVIFWSALGLANTCLRRESQGDPVLPEEDSIKNSHAERPVAKAAAFYI
jgi:hypothetical protein